MIRSLFAGVSGMRNHQTSMDVIGNNIANVNTYGYKVSRVSFHDIISQMVRGASKPIEAGRGGTNPLQVGLGMSMAAIETIHSQGNLEATGRITDLAIQGDGFFVLSDGTTNSYSRAGVFGLDGESNFVSPSTGLKVQGWMADPGTGVINTSGALENIMVAIGQKTPAKATTGVVYASNLRSSAGASYLEEGNTAGVASVTGADYGAVGGTHTLSFVDTSATATTGTYIHGTVAADLDDNNYANTVFEDIYSRTLASYGVIDTTQFQVSTNTGGTWVSVAGISAASTIRELIDAMNSQFPGITAQLCWDAANNCRFEVYDNNPNNAAGTIQIQDVGATNIAARILGAAVPALHPGAAAAANPTMVIDNFVTTGGGASLRRIYMGENDDLDSRPAVFPSSLIEGLFIDGSGAANNAFLRGTLAAPTTVVIKTTDNIHSTTVNVYDSLGSAHGLKVDFRRLAENNWSWTASLAETGLPVTSGNSGTLTFNKAGNLVTADTGPVVFTPPGASDVSVALNFGTGVTGVTQYDSAFTTVAQSQDGYAMGTMETFNIDGVGAVTAVYTNGVTKPVAQVSMALFNNPSGLNRKGDTRFEETNNSGTPQVGAAYTGGRGGIAPSTLEMSNVDLAEQFAKMIITQRGFQANARVITTSDEILTELIALKR